MTRKPSRLDGRNNGKKPVKRNGRGQFVKGSASPSPGRPALAKETAIQDVIKMSGTPENIYLALEELRVRGMKGDTKALFHWLAYTAGRPTDQSTLAMLAEFKARLDAKLGKKESATNEQ